MSFANGRHVKSTKNRAITRVELINGSRLQTREKTTVSEDLTESYQTSITLVKSSRLVPKPSSNREPVVSRMCIARRIQRPEVKKQSGSSPDLVTPDNPFRSEVDRKTVYRLRTDPESNPLQTHVLVSNGVVSESSDTKLIHLFGSRGASRPIQKSESPVLNKLHVQNGWIKPSASPLTGQLDIPLEGTRKTDVFRGFSHSNETELKPTIRSTRMNSTLPAGMKIQTAAVQLESPGIDQEDTDSHSSKHEYSKKCAVSAWLLQCNNASVMLDENEDDECNGVVVVKEMVEEDSGILAPETSESEAKPAELVICGGASEPLIEESTNQWNTFFPTPVPNKLAQSSNFVRSVAYSNSKEPRDSIEKPVDTVDRPGQHPGLPDPRATIDLFTSNERESSAHNSVHAQDWTSVSSSEWGDEMCEFDRQQSKRVREMFEEIDRMLFDATRVERNSPVAHASKRKSRNTKSSTLKNHSPTNLRFTNTKEEPDFDLSHLKGECQDWISRFPHLRVVGTQVVPYQDAGFEFYAPSKINTKMTSNTNQGSGLDTNSLKQLTGTTSVLNVLPNSSELKTGSAKGDPSTPRNSSSSPKFVPCGSEEEEIFAIDGEYEEVIAIDMDTNSHPSDTLKRRRRARRRSRRSEKDVPATTDLGQDTDKNTACPNRTNALPAELMDLLIKEVHRDLFDWLKTLASPENGLMFKRDTVSPTNLNIVRESSLAQTDRSRGDGHSQSSRLSRDLGSGNRFTHTEHTNTPDVDSCATNLAGLLQISTKALQQRDKVHTHEVTDSTNRTTDQSGSLIAPVSSSPWLAHVNRLSPQPTLYPISVVSNRPLSGVHPKIVSNAARKSVPSGAPINTEAGAGQSAIVVGVAANFHPIGRLAPLEPVRAPNGPLSTSHADDSVHGGIDISHTVHRTKNPLGSVAHTATLSQSCPTQYICPLTSSVQQNCGLSNATPMEHAAGRGGCTLPPLGTGVVTSGAVHGTLGSSVPTVPSLPIPSKSGPMNARLGAVPMQSMSHSTVANNTTLTPTPSHAHAPALRGTSANLVTQQINNSGLLPITRGQNSWNRKLPRTTRVKQNTAPSPISWSKKAGKSWRPQTSIPAEDNGENTSLPNVLDRSASTLLVRRLVGEAFSECNSPRKITSQRTSRIGSKFGGVR